MTEIFYVGKDYSNKTGGRIGLFYEITKDGFKRTDLKFIEAKLEAGEEVCIKPANEKQRAKIDAILIRILMEQ